MECDAASWAVVTLANGRRELGRSDISGYHHRFRVPRRIVPHETFRPSGVRRQHPADRGGPRLSAGGALLAVRRPAGTAYRRGTRAARSGARRGAVRDAAPAVLGVARVLAVRRS